MMMWMLVLYGITFYWISFAIYDTPRYIPRQESQLPLVENPPDIPLRSLIRYNVYNWRIKSEMANPQRITLFEELIKFQK